MSIKKNIKIMLIALTFAASFLFFKSSVCANAGMSLVADNDYLSLYVNETDTSIAVYDKQSGEYWHSNPVNADEDSLASNYYKKLMHSQLIVQYFNENVQSATMDNYNDSIVYGNYSIEKSEQGIKINYTLGKAASTLLLPDAILEERLELFKANMDKEQLKKINRNYTLVEWDGLSESEKKTYLESYPGYEGKSFHILRGGVKDYLKEELAGYFAEAGYTLDDLDADKAEAGGGKVADKDPWFVIPVEYSIEDDHFVASIDPSEIEYNKEGFYLVDIDFLPYFGAAGTDEEGYIFVPDGSGAIIRLNNGKTNVSSYTANVYGDDYTKSFMNEKVSEADPEQGVKLPVFGMVSGKKGCMGVITEGAGYANVAADISGKTTSYNNVYAGFSFLQYGPMSLSSMVGSNSYQLYSKEAFSSKYEVTYYFLNEDCASYVGMANRYRKYLLDSGKLFGRDLNDDVTFVSEFIGAIDKYKTFLGIRYISEETLTTFSQAIAITDDLTAKGIDNQEVVYSGWQKGGLRAWSEMNVKSLKKLNFGGVNISEYIAEMRARNINTYFSFDLEHIYKDKLFDGYSRQADGPQYFDHSSVYVSEISPVDSYKHGYSSFLISPASVDKAATSVQQYLNKKEIGGVAIRSISNTLYSDLLDSRYTDRETAIQDNENAISKISENKIALLDNANAYAFTEADVIMNAPMYSNAYKILDKDVPFYELVLHGVVDYTGEALNLADNYEVALLKCVETNSGLHYEWIANDNSILKDTDYEYLYSINYETLSQRAVADYSRVNEAMRGLKNVEIIKHEEVADGVILIMYADGTAVYVNYSKNTFSEGDVIVNSMDFCVRKEPK